MMDGAQRRLTTIVAADIAGFSRLVGIDEEGTLATQRNHRIDLIEPLLAEHHGRIANTAGDSFLLEFPSAVEAVRCSVAVQDGMAERNREIPADRRIEYRIGINVGDVVVDGDDLLGDGVNIAARLENICEPGDIILSDDAYRQIRDRLEFAWHDGGEHEVKNIARPVQVWRWQAIAKAISAPFEQAPLALPDKPSIAVLPFDNLSSDPEQEFFADGIVEDLITSLSRFPWLFVIARNSSFTYKGQHVSVKKVAAELGVRYVVEGSVRSSPSRLRVTVQLIDATRDNHVWAENYDRPTGDLFDLQDEITRSITGVLVPALGTAERERTTRNRRPNLDAWQAYQRGLIHFYRPYSHEDHAEARRMFDLALERDPGFSDAHAMTALMCIYAAITGLSSYDAGTQELAAEAMEAALKAVQYGDSNALAHLALARAYSLSGDFDAGVAEGKVAVRLNPNLALAHHELGFILVEAEQYMEACRCFDHALQLSPNDPSRWNFHQLKAVARYAAGTYEDAIPGFKDAMRLRPKAFWPWVFMSACLSAMGRMDEARDALVEAKKLNPNLNAAFFDTYGQRYGRVPPYMARMLDDLRKAGLPE
jgi:adenylate cyclase